MTPAADQGPRITDGNRAIRFVKADVEINGDQCRATVQIRNNEMVAFTASAQGGSGDTDQLRAVARATADALSEAFDTSGVRVRVRGVQLVEGLAQTAVMASLAATKGSDTQSLLGICDLGDDPARATALAVLNATNRYLGRA